MEISWENERGAKNRTPPGQARVKCSQVIFGCRKRPAIVNMMILMAKQFIVNQRFGQCTINFNLYRLALKKKFEMEKFTACSNFRMSQFHDRWRLFMVEENKLEI